MQIHGKEGSGASLYTICLAAKWFLQGYKVIFLCGYTMAEQEFEKQTTDDQRVVSLYTKDRIQEFEHKLRSSVSDKTVIFVKNVELFHDQLSDQVLAQKHLIISGDFNQVTSQYLRDRAFTTRVYFPPLYQEVDLSNVKMYQRLVISGEYRGITSTS